MTAVSFKERFTKLARGHWLDSMGNSILVTGCSDAGKAHELTAVVTPLVDHASARDRVLQIKRDAARQWRCGNANLEWVDEQLVRLVWATDDGRRSVWSRSLESALPEGDTASEGDAFPWRLHGAEPGPWLPLETPRDILYDGARVAALLDIRQLIGPRTEPQERLTHILMDHDLHPNPGDYLIPGANSPLWQTLQVSDSVKCSIAQRIQRIQYEALAQRVQWSGDSEVWVGRHKISCNPRDIQTLESRWVLSPKDERKSLEIARLLALYSVFDNPLSNRRNGVHLGLDPELRRQCDYELFASPLNATVPNGRFASKWPWVEWRFGSIGKYPSVMSLLPVNSIVCVNPPFTEAYLADVMSHLAELKLRYRLRISIPIQDCPWRKKLQSSLPSAQLLTTYYDASAESHTDLLHPTLLWEDPRCPDRGSDAPLLELPSTNTSAAFAVSLLTQADGGGIFGFGANATRAEADSEAAPRESAAGPVVDSVERVRSQWLAAQRQEPPKLEESPRQAQEPRRPQGQPDPPEVSRAGQADEVAAPGKAPPAEQAAPQPEPVPVPPAQPPPEPPPKAVPPSEAAGRLAPLPARVRGQAPSAATEQRPQHSRGPALAEPAPLLDADEWPTLGAAPKGKKKRA